MDDQPSVEKRMEALKKQIEEIQRSWPAHSVPAAMLQQLEELEEELESLLRETKQPKR